MSYYVDLWEMPKIKEDKVEDFKNKIKEIYDIDDIESGWLYEIIENKDSINKDGDMSLDDYYVKTTKEEERNFMKDFIDCFEVGSTLTFIDNTERDAWRYVVKENNKISEETGEIVWKEIK